MSYTTVEIDLDDIMGDIDTDDLIKELTSRGIDFPSDEVVFTSDRQKLNAIKQLFGLEEYHEDSRLIEEIQYLISSVK